MTAKDEENLARNSLSAFSTEAIFAELLKREGARLGRIGGRSGRGKAKARPTDQARRAGRVGGQRGHGKAKARSSDQARNAANARWAKARAKNKKSQNT